MSSTAAFLSELRGREIDVWLDGERLRCNAPDGALTPELLDALRSRKEEIVGFLRAAQGYARLPRAIVPLQPAGSRPPVFAVPGHNGDVFCYRALSQALGKDQPVYGLQPPGVDGRQAPLTSVEALAAYFAEQIRAFRPQGAIILAGFCAGGTVAFELAQQLIAGGAAVDSVALFGSPYPAFFSATAQTWRRIALRLDGLKKHLAALARGNLKHFAERWRKRQARAATAQDPVLALRAAVEGATVEAVRRYRPAPFSGCVKLFLPCRSWARSHLARRWRRAAHRTEEYYGLEGHTGDNMLLAPHVELYAALFQRSIKASSQTQGSDALQPVRRAA
jgi:thioesterase domain-containing protein